MFTSLCVYSLIQCRISDGSILFFTDIPELAVEEPQEKEPSVLQESSNGEQNPNDGSSGLKSVLSVGKSQSSGLDSSERPVVTFKENIKPREQSRDQSRNQQHRDGGKERAVFGKGNGMPLKNEQKKDGKRKSEVKKNSHEKALDAGKQVRGNRSSAIPVHFFLWGSICLVSHSLFWLLCRSKLKWK